MSFDIDVVPPDRSIVDTSSDDGRADRSAAPSTPSSSDKSDCHATWPGAGWPITIVCWSEANSLAISSAMGR